MKCLINSIKSLNMNYESIPIKDCEKNFLLLVSIFLGMMIIAFRKYSIDNAIVLFKTTILFPLDEMKNFVSELKRETL